MYQLKELFEQKTSNVIREISPNDSMYVTEEHYFSVGHSALKCIKLAMLAAGKEDFKNILDLPCGHGRVLRMLKAAFSKAQITACDLDRDAVDYCAKVFGATSVYSKKQPDQIAIQGKFDLIWCGSLLTHLKSSHWGSLLNLFNSLLCPGGLLIFSTQGRCSIHWIRSGICTYDLDSTQLSILLDGWERNGFGYVDYLNMNDYGVSVSSLAWVLLQLEKLPDLRLLTVTEMGWDNHQDVIACVRVET